MFSKALWFLCLAISFICSADRGDDDRKKVAKLYSNSWCEDRPLQHIRRRSRCENFSTNVWVKSIRLKDQCLSVSRDLVKACKLAKVLIIDPKNAFYGRGSDCEPDDFIQRFRPKKDCSSLSSIQEVYQVKVRGICHKLGYTNMKKACQIGRSKFFNASQALFQGGENCREEDFISVVEDDTICSELEGNGHSNVWVKMGQLCLESDTSDIAAACQSYKSKWQHLDKVYTDSDCSISKTFSLIQPEANCEKFSDSEVPVQSFSVSGSCYYYDERVTPKNACQGYKNRVTEHYKDSKFFYSSKNCDSSGLLALLGPDESCDSLRSTEGQTQVSSIMYQQSCKSFKSPQDLASICRNFPAKGPGNSCEQRATKECEGSSADGGSEKEETSSCWDKCTKSSTPTETCSRRCGVRSEAEKNICTSYCLSRGGDPTLCERLCQ